MPFVSLQVDSVGRFFDSIAFGCAMRRRGLAAPWGCLMMRSLLVAATCHCWLRFNPCILVLARCVAGCFALLRFFLLGVFCCGLCSQSRAICAKPSAALHSELSTLRREAWLAQPHGLRRLEYADHVCASTDLDPTTFGAPPQGCLYGFGDDCSWARAFIAPPSTPPRRSHLVVERYWPRLPVPSTRASSSIRERPLQCDGAMAEDIHPSASASPRCGAWCSVHRPNEQQ